MFHKNQDQGSTNLQLFFIDFELNLSCSLVITTELVHLERLQTSHISLLLRSSATFVVCVDSEKVIENNVPKMFKSSNKD